MGAAGSSMNAAETSNVGVSAAPKGHTSSPEASQAQQKPSSTKRRRESDEQPGPSPKRRRALSATKSGAPALNDNASLPLPIRASSTAKASRPVQRASEPDLELESIHETHDPALMQDAEFDHPLNSPPADLLTTSNEESRSSQVPSVLPHAAVQAAATLASEGDLYEGWRIAPEAPLSDLLRQQNRREINRAVMRLQPLTRSESFGTRTDEDDHLFTRLGASVRKPAEEDNRVDFVQKAKAARLRTRRRAAQGDRSEGRLVMPVSKKRRRSSEDVVGGRSKSNVYNIAQADGDSSPVAGERSDEQRELHGLWKTWPGMMKERWE